MFSKCKLLSFLPDISKWEISSGLYFYHMFEKCSSLVSMPNIRKWNCKKDFMFNNMFKGCISLSYIPKISSPYFNLFGKKSHNLINILI